MNPITYFWNNLYPESVLWPIVKFFRYLSSYMESKRISDKRYTVQCIVISAAAFSALFLLTGTKNPLEFFVDIPIYDLAEFHALVNGDEYALFAYMFSSAIFASMGIYLLRLFLFHAKEYSFFSVNGFLFSVMGTFVSALIDVPVQKLVYAFSQGTIPEMEGKGLTGIIILGLTLNFAAYFAIQDSFTAILSSAVGIELIMIFQGWFQRFTSNRLALLLAVSLLLRLFLEILEKLEAWRPIVGFISKWCYTPRYVIKVAFFAVSIILFLALRGSKRREERAD